MVLHENLHRENLDTYMCKDFYDEVCEFIYYKEGDTVIVCRVVPTSSYNQIGETIIGGFKNMDW